MERLCAMGRIAVERHRAGAAELAVVSMGEREKEKLAHGDL